MVNEDKSDCASIKVTAFPVAPQETANNCGDNECHDEHDIKIVSVLPFCNAVLPEIADVCRPRFSTGLEHNPANVGEQQALVCIVRVKIGVGIPMVGTMPSGPPPDRALGSAGTCKGQEIL